MVGARQRLDIEGRSVTVSSLDRVLWPRTGTTKGDLISYYVAVAPTLLPHLDACPVTLHRFPDGVDGPSFYQTRVPPHPPWVRTQLMHVFPTPDVHAPVIDSLAALVWAANIVAIELHPYLAPADALSNPRTVVFDLDPGPPATMVDCCRVALEVRDRLAALGLASFVKSSGAKGLHVVAPLNRSYRYDDTKRFARSMARRLAQDHPATVTDNMRRDLRAGRVFVDWSQNDAGKSTVVAYSLRGLPYPTVAAPLTWDEVEAAARTGRPEPLVVLLSDVQRRLDAHGDLFEPVLSTRQSLPGDR